MKVADILKMHDDGSHEIVCTLGETKDGVKIVRGNKAIGQYFLETPLPGINNTEITADDGDEFLKNLHTVYTGSRMRATKIREASAGKRMSWNVYSGIRGGQGWRNQETGEIRYQANKPSDDDDDGASGRAPSGKSSKKGKAAVEVRSPDPIVSGKVKARESKLPTTLRKSQVLAARKKLGPKLSNKIARQPKGKGGEVELTTAEVERVLKHGIVGFVSAGRNPASEDDSNLSDAQIAKRYKKLQLNLRSEGFRYAKVIGKYGEVEDSFLVMAPEADKKTILKLGARYNQDSILYSVGNKNEIVYTTGPNKGLANPGEGYQRADDSNDFFTLYRSPGGESIKFSLNLDFDRLEKQRLALRMAVGDEWTSYQGTGGGRGWQNASTGEVRYQENKPEGRGEGEEERPSEGKQVPGEVADGGKAADGGEMPPPMDGEDGDEIAGKPETKPIGGVEVEPEAADPFMEVQESVSRYTDSIAVESKTPPPPGELYYPDVMSDGNGDGVTDSSRVGVPASYVPPPPPMVRIPNLNPRERQAESDFIEAYESNPRRMALQYREAVLAETKEGYPPEFNTDDAKSMTSHWSHPGLSIEERSINRATLNTALHQTANAVAKRAFVEHLDTLEEGDQVMITVGGVGSGKGHALKNVDRAIKLKKQSKAVWDSAGDQNATENPWVQKELEKRGLKGVYVYVHADPKNSWANPAFGVVKRAGDPNDGRMVDAQVFADSYSIGAKNHQSFYDKNIMNESSSFVFLLNGKEQRELEGIPEDALKLDNKRLALWSMKTVMESNAPRHVKRGATIGRRIWGLPDVREQKEDEGETAEQPQGEQPQPQQ